MAIKDVFKTVQNFCIKNKAQIFTGLGIGAFFGGIVTAANNAPKALQAIDEKQKELGRKLTLKEIVLTGGKYYIPTAVCAASGTALVIGGLDASLKAGAAATAVAEIATQNYNVLKQEVDKVLTPEQQQTVQENVKAAQVKAADNLPSELINPNVVFMFEDEYSGVRFNSTFGQLRDGMVEANYKMMNGDITYGELIDLIALSPTKVVVPAAVSDSVYCAESGKLGYNINLKYHDDRYGYTIADIPEFIIAFDRAPDRQCMY